MHYVPGGTAVAVADVMLQDRATILKLLRETLGYFTEQNEADSRPTSNKESFNVGDWLYLKPQPFRQVTVAFRRNAKLAPKYFGPYQVVKKVGTVAYELELPPHSEIHPVFHVSLLKKKLGSHAVVQTALPVVGEDGRL